MVGKGKVNGLLAAAGARATLRYAGCTGRADSRSPNRLSSRYSIKLNTRKNMLRAMVRLAVLLGLFGNLLAAISTGGCPIETLKHQAIVDRCINHDGTDMQYKDNGLAPVATNCIITCKRGIGVTYRICDNTRSWSGPVLKCVDFPRCPTAKVVEVRADEGSLTVSVDDVEYFVTKQNIPGVFSCAPVMTRVSILCEAAKVDITPKGDWVSPLGTL
ncbi:hypothetical protein LSAT2_005337 [Lamellibrachia satsuma]|nr:hypothetical protein LSAT2_005337 [Lamellibrachia satsuma]